MNYYQHHLGDYAKDTSHLTMLEHGAYRLLLDRHYGSEQGIPEDQAYRVSHARTRDERLAVDAVLKEFFVLNDGLWINKRAALEIQIAQSKISASKANGKKGGRPCESGMPKTKPKKEPDGLSMGFDNRLENNLHQPPTTNNQTPSRSAPLSDADLDLSKPSTAGAVCVSLRALGIKGINQMHPDFLQLLTDGAMLEEFIEAGRAATAKGAGFGYVVAIVKGRREQLREAMEKKAVEVAIPPGPWFSSPEGIRAKALELGLTQGKTESSRDFMRRLNDENVKK